MDSTHPTAVVTSTELRKTLPSPSSNRNGGSAKRNPFIVADPTVKTNERFHVQDDNQRVISSTSSAKPSSSSQSQSATSHPHFPSRYGLHPSPQLNINTGATYPLIGNMFSSSPTSVGNLSPTTGHHSGPGPPNQSESSSIKSLNMSRSFWPPTPSPEGYGRYNSPGPGYYPFYYSHFGNGTSSPSPSSSAYFHHHPSNLSRYGGVISPSLNPSPGLLLAAEPVGQFMSTPSKGYENANAGLLLPSSSSGVQCNIMSPLACSHHDVALLPSYSTSMPKCTVNGNVSESRKSSCNPEKMSKHSPGGIPPTKHRRSNKCEYDRKSEVKKEGCKSESCNDDNEKSCDKTSSKETINQTPAEKNCKSDISHAKRTSASKITGKQTIVVPPVRKLQHTVEQMMSPTLPSQKIHDAGQRKSTKSSFASVSSLATSSLNDDVPSSLIHAPNGDRMSAERYNSCNRDHGSKKCHVKKSMNDVEKASCMTVSKYHRTDAETLNANCAARTAHDNIASLSTPLSVYTSYMTMLQNPAFGQHSFGSSTSSPFSPTYISPPACCIQKPVKIKSENPINERTKRDELVPENKRSVIDRGNCDSKSKKHSKIQLKKPTDRSSTPASVNGSNIPVGIAVARQRREQSHCKRSHHQIDNGSTSCGDSKTSNNGTNNKCGIPSFGNADNQNLINSSTKTPLTANTEAIELSNGDQKTSAHRHHRVANVTAPVTSADMNIPHYLPGATDWMNSSRGTMPQDIPSRLSWIPPHAEPISNHALWLANQGLNQNPYGHSGVAPTLPISFAPMTGPVDASQITVPPVGYQVARDPLTGHVLLLPSASIDMMERTRGWTHFANSAASQNSAYLSHAVHYQQMMAEQELAHLASQQQPHSCFARSSLEIFSNYAQTSTKSSHSITKDPNSSLSYERIKKSAEAVIKCDIKQECIPASDQSFECVSDSSEIAKSTVDAKMNCGRPIPVDHDTSLNVDGTDQLCCESELQVKNEVDVEKIGSDVAHRKDEEICVDESSNNHEIEKECDKIGSIVVDSILDVDTTEIEDDVEEKNVVKTEVETDKDVVEEKRVCDHESGEANLIGRVEEHGEKSDACNECEIHERKPVNEDEVAEEVNDVEKETPRSECDEIGEVNQQLPTLQVAECSGNSVPSECQPVVDFIDNHGLNLLLDSIEEFTNKEMPKLERQGDPLPLNVSSSDDDLAVPPLCSPVGAIIPPILSQTTSPNLSQVDTVSSSGLGLLCALAEQRFKEEIESVPKELIGGGSPNRCTASETDYNVPLLKREVSHHVTKHNATQHNLSPGRASPNGCPVDVMDPMELEMRLTMAELQRKYKEKQKELAKLKPKCDRNFHERLLKRGPGRPRKRLSFSSTKATPYGCTTDDNCLSDNVSSATKKPYKTFGFDTANDNVKIFPKKRSKNSGSAHDRSSSPDAFYGANQLQRSISNARKTSEETFEDNSGDGEEINDDYEPNNRKLFDDSCVPVLQKRKPGRPKKHSPKKTESATETIVAKKPKSQNLRKLQADDYEGDLKLTDDKSVNYDEDAWMRRRSERIFLNEPPNLFTCNNSGNTTSVSSQLAPVFHSTSYGSSNFASLLKNSSRSKNLHSTSKNLKRKACGTLNKPVIKKSKFSDKFSKHDNIFASLAENCKFRGDKNERYAGNDTNNNNDIQHASNRNADLVGRPSTPEPKSCAVTAEILKDQLRVLILMDGLFYAARIDAIEPPDVYGVISDGERGNRPHIYTQEEILKDSVLEVRPCSLIELHDGTRVCAYWSQQYRCLYPGTVIKSSSPSPLPNRTFVNVEFDDGDSGKIELDDIRLLPSDYPIVSVDPNPIMSGKRRRRVSGAEGLLSNERKNQAVQSNVEVSSATDAPNEEANSKESIEKERTDEVNRQTFKKRKSKSRKSSKNLTSKQENDGDNARGDSNEQNNLTMPSCENYVDKSREKIKKKSRKKGDSKSKKKCCETKRRKHRRHKEKCHHRRHHRHKHHHKHKKHKHSNEKRKQNSASDSNAKIDDQQNIEELMLPPATTTDNCDLTVKVVANEQQQQLDTDSFDSSSLSTSGSLDSTTVSSQSSDEMASEDGIQDDSKETKEQIGKNAAKNRRKDRPSSVENRSKIAAFLPAKQLWRWSGKSFKRPGMKGKAKKEFYKAITRGKETIRVGDSAVFLSTGRPNLPFIGHIEMMWESWGGNMVVKVKWFYHPEETKGGTNLNELRGALYHSSHVDENDVQTISHKCEVVSLDVYQKCKEDSSKSTKFGSMYEPNDIYYLAGSYDPTTGVITMEPNVR